MSLKSLANQWMKNSLSLLFLLVVFLLFQFTKLVHQAAAQICVRARDSMIETKDLQKGKWDLLMPLYTMLGCIIYHLTSGRDSQNNSNPSKITAGELLSCLC